MCIALMSNIMYQYEQYEPHNSMKSHPIKSHLLSFKKHSITLHS